MTFTLYLSPGGDSFTLKCSGSNIFRIGSDDQPPCSSLQEALACTTHETALAFLTKVEKNPELLERVSLYHMRKLGEFQHDGGLDYHECPLTDMIPFVKNQMNVMDFHSIPALSSHLCDEKVIAEPGVTFFGSKVVNFKYYEVSLDALRSHIESVAKSTGQEPGEQLRPKFRKKILSEFREIFFGKMYPCNFTIFVA